MTSNIVMDVSEPWFTHIRNLTKRVEGRKDSPKWGNIHYGTVFVMKNGSERLKVLCCGVRYYSTLDEFLRTEGIGDVLPGVESLEEARKVYLEPPCNWSPDEITEFGIKAIEIEVLDRD